MKIVVFGATGNVGRLVVPEALSRGHQVVAFVHRRAPARHPRLTIVRGDVHDPKSVARAMQGCDAIISCLSSWSAPEQDVLTAAMHYIVPAMKAMGARRIVTLTGNMALLPDEEINTVARRVHAFLVHLAPNAAKDAEDHLKLLTASTLDWTSVRSPVMLPFGGKAYRFSQTVTPFGTIPRAAVAASLVDLAETNDMIRQAPLIRRP